MGWLNIDDGGLDLHIGDFSFYSVNGDGEEPGCFSMWIPIGPFGSLVMGWEPSVGFDLYRISPGEALVLRLSDQELRKLEGLEEPTDEQLRQLEQELSAGETYL